MAQSADHYRAEAERLRREAAEAKNTSIREQLLEVAQSYEGLAETVDRLARIPG
jgi:hypothetical protein